MYNFWLWKLSKRLIRYRYRARQKGRFWAKFKNNNNIQAFLYRIISLASFSWRIYISVTNCFAWVPNYIGKVFKCWPPFWPEFRRVKCTTSMFVLEQQRCLYDFYQIWKKKQLFLHFNLSTSVHYLHSFFFYSKTLDVSICFKINTMWLDIGGNCSLCIS